MKARSHGPRRGISSRVLVSSAVVGLMVALGGSAGIGRASPTNRAATAPVNSALPTIVAAGTVVQGATVVASTGVWSGTTPLVFRYQWQRCDGAGANCSEIVDAIAQTYTVVSADVGDTLRVVVAASNSRPPRWRRSRLLRLP
jgi:hypothetical protein